MCIYLNISVSPQKHDIKSRSNTRPATDFPNHTPDILTLSDNGGKFIKYSHLQPYLCAPFVPGTKA